ncbi:MAG: hypothetical protein V1847_04385 [Candidatus Diapherotrites archaeon]
MNKKGLFEKALGKKRFARGQYFEGYDLLIAVIFAALVLGIIIGVVTELDKHKGTVSMRLFVQGLQSAVNSPDGTVVKVEHVVFPKLSFSTSFLAGQQSTVPAECFTLQGLSHSGQTIRPDTISILQSFEQTVFMKCQQETGGNCDISCIVSFGQDLQ